MSNAELAYLIGSLIGIAVSVGIGLRICGDWLVGRRLFWFQAAGVAAASVAVAGCVGMAIVWIALRLAWPIWTIPAGMVVGAALAAFLVPLLLLRLSQGEATRILIVIVVATVSVVPIIVLPLPFFFRGYLIPTNAMAPTILGQHFLGKCPKCGSDTIVFVDQNYELAGERFVPSDRALCTSCLRPVAGERVAGSLRGGERIMVRTTCQPNRWDPAVFVPPIALDQIYVKRLVGLPGEKIHIREGAVWIDGKKLELPPHLTGLRWTLPPEAFSTADYAVREPLQLADDEYFMLGDNSENSYDSRFWGPVAQDQLRGVAWIVYFPRRGWRVIK